MAGRGAKRKLKKLRRETEEASAVLSQCIFILGQHGHVVSLPYEVPQILEELLSGGVVRVGPSGEGLASPREEALARLEMVEGRGSVSDFEEPARVVEVDLDDLDFSSVDFDASDPVAVATADAPDADGRMPPISMEAMEQRVGEATDRMMNRVATHGVHHKRGQGPAGMEGRRMQSADNSGSLDDMGDPSSRPSRGEGRINRVTGMSREQSAAIIAKITGKEMGAPAGSPVAKPR